MNKASILGGALVAAAALVSPSANAEDWYIGAGVGKSWIDTGDAKGQIDTTFRSLGATSSVTSDDSDNDTGYKLFVGYRFHPNFAVEGGYFNLGKFSVNSTITAGGATGLVHTEGKNKDGINLDLIGLLPLDWYNFSLWASVGVTHSKTEVNGSGAIGGTAFAFTGSQSDTNWKAGLGFRNDFNANWALRGGYERYRVPLGTPNGGDGDVNLWSFNVIYKF